MALSAVSANLYNFGVGSLNFARATVNAASSVLAAGLAVFSRPQPSVNDDHGRIDSDRFFVHLNNGDADDQKDVGFFDEQDDVIAYAQRYCRGGDNIPTKRIAIDADRSVDIAAIFLRDLQSLKTDDQQLYIGDERIVWPAHDFDRDAMNQQTVQKVVNYIGSDADTVLKISALASQKASILLRQRVEDEFRDETNLANDFIPKFVPGQFTTTISIIRDKSGPRVCCTLNGKISAIERPPQSMDDLPIVKEIEPVQYRASASFDPFRNEVEYSIVFE